MTMFKTGIFATLVSLGAILQSAAWATEYDQGRIRFAADKDGSKTCVIEYKTGDYEFADEKPDVCVNDEMSYFRLDNVPSASKFWLEKRRCTEAGGWVLVLSVYKQPTSTEWISIPSLKGFAEGDIIVAGLRLVEKKAIGGDDLKGELSCLRIKRSALP